MALTTTITVAELARVGVLAYQGQTYRISLANNTTGLTALSTVANWDAVKLSGSGYTDKTGTIAAGSYDATDAAYEMPQIAITFTAAGGNWVYNTVYVVLTSGGTSTLHSVIVESPSVTLVDGASVTYRITLFTND
jgi:hypothetical protein